MHSDSWGLQTGQRGRTVRRLMGHLRPRFREGQGAAVRHRSQPAPRLSASLVDAALCFKHERVVAKDNVVRLDDMLVQILPGPNRLGYAKVTVTIRESLDSRYSVYLGDHHLPAKLIPARMLLVPRAIKSLGTLNPLPPPTVAKSPPNHPWRNYPTVTKSLNTYRA